MTLPTISGFMDGLAALSVSGISKNYGRSAIYTVPPANLPAMFVRLPSSDNAPWAAIGGANLGEDGLVAEIVVLVKSLVEGQVTDVDDVVTMMDNMRTALKASPADSVSLSNFRYRIRPGIFQTDQQHQYWGFVAEVTGTG